MATGADRADGDFAGLRALAGCGGCAAKSPMELVATLAGLAAGSRAADAALLVGLAPPDDAAVYALDAERALVATVDFFPPIVDDPATYGAVAAANAVSDIYAMGGSVTLALALSGFPENVPAEVIASVNRAAAEVVAACGGSLAGGHSIRCGEPVFGLCVLGFVHPARIWRKAGARPGDALMLSKPLGTGVLVSSGEHEAIQTAVDSMRITNQQAALALQGPAVTVSTACSSSAKAFASAQRWLHTGVVDAVVVAGVEALSASLLHGFRSLSLVSEAPCQPFDAKRRGISIGEAAAFALLQRADDEAVEDEAVEGGLQLLGYGEANDAHHMSAPHPQGLGAEAALDAALARAGVDAAAVDFVNLHGTASAANDAVEAALVARRYAPTVHACGTKGLTGHTMGAAGLLEAVICLLALQGRGLAGTAHTEAADPDFGPLFAQQLRLWPTSDPTRLAASHSFGFGGNNCVLLFGTGAGAGVGAGATARAASP